MLQAHFVQAQVVERRVAEASELWLRLHALRKEAGLLERTEAALAIADGGLAVTNSSYRVAVAAEGGPGAEPMKPVTASRDLGAMVTSGLLEQRGAASGASYVAAGRLATAHAEVRGARKAIDATGLFDS